MNANFDVYVSVNRVELNWNICLLFFVSISWNWAYVWFRIGQWNGQKKLASNNFFRLWVLLFLVGIFPARPTHSKWLLRCVRNQSYCWEHIWSILLLAYQVKVECSVHEILNHNTHNRRPSTNSIANEFSCEPFFQPKANLLCSFENRVHKIHARTINLQH